MLTYKEDIYLYGIKHSIWMVPFIFGTSIFWYYYIHNWQPSESAILVVFPPSPFTLLFGSWQGWLNILLMFMVTLTGAFVGWQVKELVRIYVKKEEPFLIKKVNMERETKIEEKGGEMS
ncbi:MAG: hypothetical protein ACXACB_00270 [Promethearchaeota archaeon]|jgi:hypothetical protein